MKRDGFIGFKSGDYAKHGLIMFLHKVGVIGADEAMEMFYRVDNLKWSWEEREEEE